MKQALRDENMFERLRSCDLSSCLSSLLDPVEEPSYIRSLNTCHTCWHQAALSAGVWIYGSAAGPAHSCCLFSRKTVCAWCKSLMFSIHQCKRTFWGFTCVWQYCWWGEGEGDVEEMIDASVRVQDRVDIYGPRSGTACCGLGGLPQARTKPQGPTGSPFRL